MLRELLASWTERFGRTEIGTCTIAEMTEDGDTRLVAELDDGTQVEHIYPREKAADDLGDTYVEIMEAHVGVPVVEGNGLTTGEELLTPEFSVVYYNNE